MPKKYLNYSDKLNKLKKFIARSNAKHQNYYNYDKVEYVNSNSKVTITCPLHDDFEQRAGAHCNGADVLNVLKIKN